MFKFYGVILLAAGSFFLTGCQQEKNYDYLISHPDALKQEIEYCQNLSDQTQDKVKYCQMVQQADTNFVALVNEWQADQEAFGEKIMLAEADAVKAQMGVKTAQVELNELQKKTADAESIKVTQDKLNLAVKDQQEKQSQVEAMLGVLSLTTPQ